MVERGACKIKQEAKGKISKYASMINRFGQIYFDRELKQYEIGSGQQFFLLSVNDFPGISQFELVRTIGYDKGTTAKAVKKLEELQYLRREIDRKDKRVYKLFVTEKAGPVIEATLRALEQWREILMTGLTEEEIEMADRLMQRISQNACLFIKKEIYQEIEKI